MGSISIQLEPKAVDRPGLDLRELTRPVGACITQEPLFQSGGFSDCPASLLHGQTGKVGKVGGAQSPDLVQYLEYPRQSSILHLPPRYLLNYRLPATLNAQHKFTRTLTPTARAD